MPTRMAAENPGVTPALVRYSRCLRLGRHCIWIGLGAAVAYSWVSDEKRLRLKQRWSHRILTLLAVRIEAPAIDAPPGCLIVANHISWLDIYALNAARPVAFVSKSEVRSWPLIGRLAAHTDTLFIRRSSRQDAIEACGILARRLGESRDVAIFPEGTTTDGSAVLEFKGALFQSAIDAGRPVQPVSIAYYDRDGHRTDIPAYAGETTMLESLAAVLACRSLTVCLRPTPALAASGMSRRELATAARGAIAFSLGVPAREAVPNSVDFPAEPESATTQPTAG